MAYTPTNWQTGDTITAEKLNKMEGGIESANAPFVVTLTPTALDYSGEMDKTVAEITAAYQAGRKIVFRIMSGVNEYTEADSIMRFMDSSTYPSFNGFIVDASTNVFIFAHTNTTSDGTKNTYSTTVYALTPMS